MNLDNRVASTALSLLFVAVLMLPTGCAEDPLLPLNSACSLSPQCASGLCLDGNCVRKSDDLDGDCVPNGDDPVVDDPTIVRAFVCKTVGVCANAKVACPDVGTTPFCDYSEVARYEPDGETRCDFVDNDCDGTVDNVVDGLSCCQEDIDCDDGDACTVEACTSANACQYEPLDSLLCQSACTDTLAPVVSAPHRLGVVRDVVVDGDQIVVASDYGISTHVVDTSQPSGPRLAEQWAEALGGGASATRVIAHMESVFVADDQGVVRRYTIGADGTVTQGPELMSGVEVRGLVVPGATALDPPPALGIVHDGGVDFWVPGSASVPPFKLTRAVTTVDSPEVAAAADLLVVAADGTYQFFDASDVNGAGSELPLLGSVPAAADETISALAVAKQVAIVAGTDAVGVGQLTFVDFSLPGAPAILGAVSTPELIAALTASPTGDVLYLQGETQLHTMSLVDAAVETSTISASVELTGVALSSGDAYVALAAGEAGVVVRDRADLADTTLGVSVALPKGGSDIVEVAGRAFVALGARGLGTFDLSPLTSPSDPPEVLEQVVVEVVAGFNAVARIYPFKLAGEDWLALAGPDGRVALVDVSDPEATLEVAGEIPPHEQEGLADLAAGPDGRLYLAYGALGVRIVDATNPAAPSVLETIEPPSGGEARGLSAAATRLYVAFGPAGLRTFSINGGTMVPLSLFDGAGSVDDVAVNDAGTMVALKLSAAGGLAFVDVTQGASPALGPQLASPSFPESSKWGHRLAWRGDRLAVSWGTDGVGLVAVTSNSAELVASAPAVGTVGATSWATRDYLLVADDLGSVTVLQPLCGQ